MADLTTLQNVKEWLDLGDRPITGVSKDNPSIITCANHNFKSGRRVMVSSVGGATQVNGGPYTITVLDANRFSIGISGVGFTTYTSGGFVGADDVLLTGLISRVSSWIQSYLNRNLASDEYSEAYSGNGSNTLMLANYPVTEVASVSVNNIPIPASSLGSYGYVFDQYSIKLVGGGYFYKGVHNVLVEYTAGFETGDRDLLMAEQACIQLISLKYKERERIGHSSKSVQGETVTFDVKKLPSDVQDMLRNLKKVVPI